MCASLIRFFTLWQASTQRHREHRMAAEHKSRAQRAATLMLGWVTSWRRTRDLTTSFWRWRYTVDVQNVTAQLLTEQGMHKAQHQLLVTKQRRDKMTRLLRHTLSTCRKHLHVKWLLRGLSALRQNVANGRTNDNKRTAAKLAEKANRLKHDLQKQVGQARITTALMHVHKCRRSWQIRHMASALRRWHVVTLRTKMATTLEQAQSSASKLLVQSQGVATKQRELFRRAKLQGVSAHWRRCQLTFAFNTLQAAMLSARKQVLDRIYKHSHIYYIHCMHHVPLAG